MANYIRLFKGIDAVPVADGTEVEITMRDADTDSAAWERVTPAYMDTVGDTAFRNQISFQSEYRYQNNTGRNDLDTAKVTQDGEYLYFHVTTVNELVTADDVSWMNLYLDICLLYTSNMNQKSTTDLVTLILAPGTFYRAHIISANIR